jgi:hypothetical protein
MHRSDDLAAWGSLGIEPAIIAEDLESITYSVLTPQSIGAGGLRHRSYRFEAEVR